MWGGGGDVARKSSGSGTIPSNDEAAGIEEEEEPFEVEEREGGAAAAARQVPKMKTLAKTVLMFGGLALCPKVDTLQNQVCVGCIDWLRLPLVCFRVVLARWTGGGGGRGKVRGKWRLPAETRGWGDDIPLLQQPWRSCLSWVVE